MASAIAMSSGRLEPVTGRAREPNLRDAPEQQDGVTVLSGAGLALPLPAETPRGELARTATLLQHAIGRVFDLAPGHISQSCQPRCERDGVIALSPLTIELAKDPDPFRTEEHLHTPLTQDRL